MIEVRTLSEFDELPEYIPPDESKYVEAGRKFLIFYERILYKWKNTMSIEKHPGKYIMYFTGHKHWGIAEHESGDLSYAAIEGYLGIKFFAIFQKMLAHKLFDWRNILLEKSANLIADYAVHLFEAMDCARDLHGDKWEVLAKYFFWKQHKNRFDFEMLRDITDIRSCSVKTSHSKLFTSILPNDVVLKTELKPKATVSYYGETIQEEHAVHEMPFYWPPPTNFKAREITAFSAYKSLTYLPSPIRKFFIELSRVLDSSMQIQGSFHRNDVGKYEFNLTLSIRDWEWLLAFSQVPEVDAPRGTSRVVIRNTEIAMMTELFDRTVEILMIPEDFIAQINQGHSSTTKSVACVVSQLLSELRYYNLKSDKPWELLQWHKVVTDFWSKEGKFEKKEKVLGCRDVSDVIVFKKKKLSRNKVAKLLPKFVIDELCEKIAKPVQKELSTTGEISASHESKISPKRKKLLRNGRTIVKRRRGTFSFPCRGYVPPGPKALHDDEISIQQAEKTNRVLQRKLFSENNPEFAQLVKIFECNKHCYEISVSVRDFLPGKTIVAQNIRSFFYHILSDAKLSLTIMKRRYDVENVLYFSLVPNASSLNLPLKKCLQETNWIVEKQSSLTPAEVLEKIIDRILMMFIEQGALMPVLYDIIHREVPLNLIPLIAQPVVIHLQKLLQEGN